jgi:plasmid maintenance system antidote protein VapI
MPRSATDICNQALDLIKGDNIQSMEESSLTAQKCRRFYPQIVDEMLSGGHDWSFGITRVLLAELATNDRTSEWLYAYGLPSDVANPIRVLPDLTALGLDLPIPLPGQPYAETWASAWPALTDFSMSYVLDGTTIYTNAAAATLEYSRNTVEAALIPAMAVRAIVHDLASRLAMPIKGDKELRLELEKEADLFWQRAIADDRNRQPQTAGPYISEAEIARGGGVVSLAGI